MNIAAAATSISNLVVQGAKDLGANPNPTDAASQPAAPAQNSAPDVPSTPPDGTPVTRSPSLPPDTAVPANIALQLKQPSTGSAQSGEHDFVPLDPNRTPIVPGQRPSNPSLPPGVKDIGLRPLPEPSEPRPITAPNQAAKDTMAAVDNNDPAAFTVATSHLSDLEKQYQTTHKMSDADYKWMRDYYDELGPNIPKLDTWLNQDPAGRKTQGQVIADGLLDLTQAAEQPNDAGVEANSFKHTQDPKLGGRGGVAGLGSIQKYVNLKLGDDVPNNPYITTDIRNDPGSTLRATWDSKTGKWVVANQDKAFGFTDLLSSYASTGENAPTGGSEFSMKMGEAGISWKQQMNTIEANTYNYYEAELEMYHGASRDEVADAEDSQGVYFGFPEELSMTKWNGKLFPSDDTPASNALKITSRNVDGSAKLLINHDSRRDLIGLNWDNGKDVADKHQYNGASMVLMSGTMPSADDNAKSNEAAYLVMHDTGIDYQNLSKTLANSDDIKDALTNIAVDHIDTFALPKEDEKNFAGSNPIFKPGANDHMMHVDLQNGTTGHAVYLNQTQANSYLKLISSFGDQHYAEVQTQAQTRGVEYVTNALNKDPTRKSEEYQNAWKAACTLQGHVVGAGQSQLLDKYTNNDDERKKFNEMAAKHQAYRDQLQADKKRAGFSDMLAMGASGASANPWVSGGLWMASTRTAPPLREAPDDSPYIMEAYKQATESGRIIRQDAANKDYLDNLNYAMGKKAADNYNNNHNNNNNNNNKINIDMIPLPGPHDKDGKVKTAPNGTQARDKTFPDHDLSIPYETVNRSYNEFVGQSKPINEGSFWGNNTTQGQIRYRDYQCISWDIGLRKGWRQVPSVMADLRYGPYLTSVTPNPEAPRKASKYDKN